MRKRFGHRGKRLGAVVLASVTATAALATPSSAGQAVISVDPSIGHPSMRIGAVRPAPTTGPLAGFTVNGLTWTYEVVQIGGVDRLRLYSMGGGTGYYDFPPQDPIVSTSFSESEEAVSDSVIAGFVPTAAVRVVIEMADGRSIEAVDMVALPPLISRDYVLFVASVPAPLTPYSVVAIDSQGQEVARRAYDFAEPPK